MYLICYLSIYAWSIQELNDSILSNLILCSRYVDCNKCLFRAIKYKRVVENLIRYLVDFGVCYRIDPSLESKQHSSVSAPTSTFVFMSVAMGSYSSLI